jgi:uncharacterized repeat protein (TIGR01451 family)
VDLSIPKAPPAENPLVGENAVFALTATNESTLLPETGVVVTDFMPAGLSFVGSDCGAMELAGEITWNIGGMPPNTSQVCTLTFLRLDAAAIYNSAQVTGNETDNNTSNDLDGAELPSVQSIVEVPTLDYLGVALLALGLVAAALLRLRP